MSAWPTAFLGDVCRVRRGSVITQKKATHGDVPVIAGGIGPAYYHNTANREANVITVSGSGANAGFVNFFDRSIWASDCSTIEPNDEALDVGYVHLFMLNMQRFINDNFRQGAAQPHVYPKDLARLEIPLPPLQEQRRIVAEMNQAFAALDRARANAEANLADAEELLALSTDALCADTGDGWTFGLMGDHCSFEGGYAFKSGDAVDNSNVQVVRIGNLYKNVLDLDRKPAFYPTSFADEYSRFRLRSGDIILSLTGTVGKQDYGFAVEVPKCERALLLNQRVARISPKDNDRLTSRFLLRLLRSKSFVTRLYKISRGTRQANLSTKDIAGLEIALPPLSKQKEIAKQLQVIDDHTETLAASYLAQSADLSDLRQSILQKAFAGEPT